MQVEIESLNKLKSDIDKKIENVNNEVNYITNKIEKVDKTIKIVKENIDEKVSDVDNFGFNQLELFFANRYGKK